MIPEPAYTLLENVFCIAGSCESYWSKVKSDLIQQTTSSIIGEIGNRHLTIEGLVEDFVIQVISAPISNLTEYKVWSVLIDTGLDSTIDLGSQVYHNGWDKVNWKQVLQTGVNTLVTKLIYSCALVCVSKGFLFQYMEELWFEGLWWYHAYESFLIGEKGTLTAMLQDGHLESFVYQKDHWENTRKENRKYVLIEDRERKEFCLIAQEAGNYYENTYNESGQLIRVKEQRGAIRSTLPIKNRKLVRRLQVMQKIAACIRNWIPLPHQEEECCTLLIKMEDWFDYGMILDEKCVMSIKGIGYLV